MNEPTTPPTLTDSAAHGSPAVEPPTLEKSARAAETGALVLSETVDWLTPFRDRNQVFLQGRKDIDLAFQRQRLESREVRCNAGSTLQLPCGDRFLELRFPWRLLIPLFFKGYRIEKPEIGPILDQIRAERQAKRKEVA